MTATRLAIAGSEDGLQRAVFTQGKHRKRFREQKYHPKNLKAFCGKKSPSEMQNHSV